KSIVLLRHPFAVAASSLNFGNNYEYHKTKFAEWSYENSSKSGTFFSQFEDKYELIVSGFTLLVFQTVSQFAYILEHYDRENSIIVFYEHLVMDKKHVHLQMEQFFQKRIDYSVFDKLLNQQSFSSDANHTEADATDQLSKWKKRIDDQDIIDGLNIFKAFGFNLYTEDILPDSDSIVSFRND